MEPNATELLHTIKDVLWRTRSGILELEQQRAELRRAREALALAYFAAKHQSQQPPQQAAPAAATAAAAAAAAAPAPPRA